MSDSGFDTLRSKDQKLSLRAKISLGLLTMGLLTACGTETNIPSTLKPAISQSPTHTQTYTPPTETPTPVTPNSALSTPDQYTKEEMLIVAQQDSIATATAEAATGELMAKLPEEIKESAVNLGFCSGTLISLEKISDNLSIAIVDSAGHCVTGMKPENLHRGVLNQPHKGTQSWNILEMKTKAIYDGITDFAVFALLLEGDTTDLKPLGIESISTDKSNASAGDPVYGLAFPTEWDVVQPIIGEVLTVDENNTIVTDFHSSKGGSGTGLFINGKLSHIYSSIDPVEGRRIHSIFYPIPENHTEMVASARSELIALLAENMQFLISPEVAVETLNKELLPSIANVSCTQTDASGNFVDVRYPTFLVIPPSDLSPDYAFSIDVQGCVTPENVQTVVISDPDQPSFMYETSPICPNTLVCALPDRDRNLRSNFPAIPIEKIKSANQISYFPNAYTLGLDGTFHLLDPNNPTSTTLPGSPLVVFDSDGKYVIIGLNYGDHLFTFPDDVSQLVGTAASTITHLLPDQ